MRKNLQLPICGILLSFFLFHLPLFSFAQGGDGLRAIFEFGLLMLNIAIIFLYLLPLITLSVLGYSSNMVFFSIFVYLLSFPGILILGASIVALTQDESKEALEIGGPLFFYLVLSLACFGITLKKDVAAYKKRKLKLAAERE